MAQPPRLAKGSNILDGQSRFLWHHRLKGVLLSDVGAGFTPARPNLSSALAGETSAYRRTRRRKAGACIFKTRLWRPGESTSMGLACRKMFRDRETPES